jgi:hypothetical protein
MDKTLLGIANNVLLNAGDRTVVTTNSTIGTMVKNSIRSAINDVCLLSDWPWMQDDIIADSWDDHVATLPDSVKSVRFVAYDTGDGYATLLAMPQQEFVRYDNWDFDNSTIYGCGQYYCIFSPQEIHLNPYPSTDEEQSKFHFFVTKWAEMPSTDSTEIVMPDVFVELVIARASYLYGVIRSGDPARFAQHQNQFETRAQALRDRYQGNHPTSGGYMYRRGR